MDQPGEAVRRPTRSLVALLGAIVLIIATAALPAMAADDREVSGGSITWGVKESFRTYVEGPVANGQIRTWGTASTDDEGRFVFAGAEGRVGDDGSGTLSTTGTVRFTGHDGELDVTFRDPEVVVSADGTGTVEVGYAAAGGTSQRVVVADLTDAEITVSGPTARLDEASATLTEAGTAIFSYRGSGFYDPGEQLDPVSARASLAPVTPPSTSDPSTSEPTTSGPTTSEPSTSGPTTSEPSDPSTSGGGNGSGGNGSGGSGSGSGGNGSGGNGSGSGDNGSGSNGSGSGSNGSGSGSGSGSSTSSRLTWGVKESFRSYVTGPIADGRVTVANHARVANGVYVFPQRSTTADPPSARGTTRYRGSVRFTGHDGVLDLTMSNPRVVVGSGDAARFVVDVRSGGGSTRSVTVANLDLGKGSRRTTSGSVTYSGVPVRLSSSGASLFRYNGSSFYPVGTVMDPLTFTVGGNASVSGSGSTTTIDSSSAGSGSGSSPRGSDGSGSGVAASAPEPASGSSAGAGSLTWGVRTSFREYITGPIANGSISVSGGARASGSTAWTFPQQGAADGDGGASYRGDVRFTGHGGILDLTFSDPKVVTSSANRAGLSVSVGSRRVDIADLNLAGGSTSTQDGATVHRGVPATLTSSGAGIFAYNGSSFYQAGEALDPVTFVVGSAGSDAGAGAQTVASADGAADAAEGSGSDTDASSTPSAELPESACVATGRELTWGFKESFRSYISGSIANGEWTTSDGAGYETPTFIWPEGEGELDAKSRSGQVDFPGTVHFTGHDGMLDTTISDPQVRLDGDTATLLLDSEGVTMDTAMSGGDEKVTQEDVPFVQIDLADADVSTDGGTTTITATDAGTTLTEQGSVAFPNYAAGDAFDPISFSITADSSCVDAPSGAASTGDGDQRAAGAQDAGDDAGLPGWVPWVGGGAGGAAAAVAATLLLLRRRLTGAHA